MAKSIYIAATMQNDGKTTLSLGLITAFKRKFKKVGFIKPIGQRYLIEQGYKVDEDSVLIERICGVKCKLKDMSPVAIERGFTEKYILHGKREKLISQITGSFNRISKNKNLVVIEGTGHAGVGSVLDCSNAQVAKLLNSKVILISSGGIGRPIDEIMLNMALFEKEGVEVIGVIVNKVHPEKYKKISRLVRLGLKKKGLPVLGVMPYQPILAKPTIQQILEEMKIKLLCGQSRLKQSVGNVIVAAMEPHEALKYIKDKSLVITPGDREDILLSVLARGNKNIRVSGIVLSGGIIPHQSVLDLMKEANIPVLLAQEDTYRVAAAVHDLTIKIRPEDKEKIRLVSRMVEEYIDLPAILAKI